MPEQFSHFTKGPGISHNDQNIIMYNAWLHKLSVLYTYNNSSMAILIMIMCLWKGVEKGNKIEEKTKVVKKRK